MADMHVYTYKGNATFVNADYNLKVQPNTVFKTRYILPEGWPFEKGDTLNATKSTEKADKSTTKSTTKSTEKAKK